MGVKNKKKYFAREKKKYYKRRNTIEDYLRDFRLELDEIVFGGWQHSASIPGNFKDPHLKYKFLTVCRYITETYLQYNFQGGDKEKFSEKLGLLHEEELPSPSLFEQYSNDVDGLVEKLLFKYNYERMKEKKGQEWFDKKLENITSNKIFEITRELYKKNDKMVGYVKESLVNIYELTYNSRHLQYSDLFTELGEMYFGDAQKDLDKMVEKIIFSSKELIDIVDIEQKLIQRSEFYSGRVHPNRIFKESYISKSSNLAEDKINNFTLKLGTSVENFIEFIRKVNGIEKPSCGGDYSKIKHIISEIEDGSFTVDKLKVNRNSIRITELEGNEHSLCEYRSMLQEILPRQLKNAFLYNDVYREFKELRNNGTHSSIFDESEGLVFHNGIQFLDKKNNGDEPKLIPAVSYLQDIYRDITNYMLETLYTILAPATAPVHFIPPLKNEHEEPYHEKAAIKEIAPRQELEIYKDIVQPFQRSPMERYRRDESIRNKQKAKNRM